MRRLQHVEATAAVFGVETVGIDGVGDEGAIRTAVIGLELGQQLAVGTVADDRGQQVGLGRLAEILIISRNVLVIRLDDGTEIKLVR